MKKRVIVSVFLLLLMLGPIASARTATLDSADSEIPLEEINEEFQEVENVAFAEPDPEYAQTIDSLSEPFGKRVSLWVYRLNKLTTAEGWTSRMMWDVTMPTAVAAVRGLAKIMNV
ncbi:hypothetical protein ACFLZZ_03950 [Nanoarchaeota archaeon]